MRVEKNFQQVDKGINLLQRGESVAFMQQDSAMYLLVRGKSFHLNFQSIYPKYRVSKYTEYKFTS